MTKKELSTILDEIGWSQSELCRRVKIHPNTLSRWEEIPGSIEAYVMLAWKLLGVK